MKKWLQWFFSEKNGRIVVWQKPNPPLILWIIFALISHFAHANVRTIASALSLLALVWWAVLEIGWGDNPFRRALGIVVLVALLLSRIGVW